MARTAMVQARMEPTLKNNVEKIFSAVGLSATEAITVFYKQVELTRGIPFEVKMPNKETRAAIAEGRKGRGKKFISTKALFQELSK
ncbi:MAG: type II toxin-antitoxin system RelB/DinJ family antitoxin [Ignavibacteriales bacterium]|nr:type II toxin-antitoxin system RelB/DinJ family antitoxin [Ignavibacteriales bacterium]